MGGLPWGLIERCKEVCPVIEVRGLVKRYGSRLAVDHLSFTVPDGQIFGFLGPNGAGKSTTMNLMTGYLGPTEGEVLIDGHSITQEPEKAKAAMGYLPEQPPLYPDMTVEEYLLFAARLKKVPRDQREDQLDRVTEMTGTDGVRKRLIRNLSKGYRQRVGLAQALIHDPEVLLLDEPTTGLDPNQIVEIRELIKNIGREKTVIMSSHILAEIEATCDRVLIINKGKIVADGTSAELRNKSDKGKLLKICIQGGEDEDIYNELALIPELENIISSTPHHFEIQCERATEIEKKIFDICCQNNWYISEMTPVETRLEDIFRQVTKN